MPLAEIQQQIMRCEQEALALSSHIQPHGALIFLDRERDRLTQVSRGAAERLALPATELLGQRGLDWVAHTLPADLLLPKRIGQRSERLNALESATGSFDLSITTESRGWLLEFEPTASSVASMPLAAVEFKPIPIADAIDLTAIGERLVAAIQQLTGYSRVMLYRFHPDWSGEVVAEAVVGGLGSYLTLRFPAGDIPANARALYAQNPYRHIPDVAAAAHPEPILSGGDGAEPLDLTRSVLRSVSPVHLQYLHNMGVAAAYSISILVEGRLWGLIACHHTEANGIPLPLRQRSVEFVGRFATMVQVHEAGQYRRCYQRLLEVTAPLQPRLKGGESLIAVLTEYQQPLLNLFKAQSLAIAIGVEDRLTAIGAPVSLPFLEALHRWALRHQSEDELALDTLPEALAALGAAESPPWSGVLAQRLPMPPPKEGQIDLYWLRHEEASEIAWAGNPDKPIEESADGLRFSPRYSFERWVAVRRGYSAPWSSEERFTAQQWLPLLRSWL